MDEQIYYSRLTCPIGELLLLSTNEGLTEVRVTDTGKPVELDGDWQGNDELLQPAIEQLRAYFAGELLNFDLPLVLRGTRFQRKVWEKLRSIPYGTTVSYSWLAKSVGLPSGARAVGGANGSNKLPIVVPCHRVIAADGSLGGFGLGLGRKRW